MIDDKRAVVIGIDNYAGPGIEKLSGAVLDAQEVCQVLRDNGGFKVKDEHLLINRDATSENIRSAISFGIAKKNAVRPYFISLVTVGTITWTMATCCRTMQMSMRHSSREFVSRN
jgi:hypothetical protein